MPLKYIFVIAVFFLDAVICPARADFSSAGMVSYLSGIPALEDSLRTNLAGLTHPLAYSADNSRYTQYGFSSQMVLKSLRGQKKDISHGIMSAGVNLPFGNSGGVHISLDRRSGNLGWPFMDKTVTVGGDYVRTGGSVAGYLTRGDKARGALLLGAATDGGFYFSGEGESRFPGGFSGSLRFSRIPYKWGLDVGYDTLTKKIPAETVSGDLEAGISWEKPRYIRLFLSVNRKTLDTPGGTEKKHADHFQVWDAGIKGWKVAAESRLPVNLVLDGYFGRDIIDGSLRLLYNGEQYLQGFFDGDRRRFGAGIGLKDRMPAFPRLRFDRVATNLDITKGVGDSWPFTPKQIEVFGDMKWTFDGDCRIVSNSVTLDWKNIALPNISAGFARVYVDYGLYTVKRSFTGNPMDLLFGRYSEEHDRIGYYDAASVTFRKKMEFRTFSLDMGLGQIVPVKYSKKTEKGAVAEEPSLKIKKISLKYFGGFFADISLKKSF